MTTTKEMIEVMQASEDGKPIERRYLPSENWVHTATPLWDWVNYVYRIVETKPSWDWSHVTPEINYLVRASDGEGLGLTSRPDPVDRWWRIRGNSIRARYIASYDPGTCEWQDSLVVRPGYVEATQ